jgi:dTDP-4-dehydrorhamnose reductase
VLIQEESLRLARPCKFFSDEYRSPILVHDVARVVLLLLSESHSVPFGTYNAGGPERLSRADMAHAIALHCGLEPGRVDVTESAAVKRAGAATRHAIMLHQSQGLVI